jgi:lysophospholipase L1-like esterase
MPLYRLVLFCVTLLAVSPALLVAAAPSLEALRMRLDSGEPTRVVCFGDSITGAYYHTGGRRAWCDMLGIALQSLYPRARVEMINAGVSGHTTAQALARIDKDVIARMPHLVVVMFGMNDVARLPLEEYIANLQTIIEKCHAAGASVVVCTPNAVIENAARPNAKLALLAERLRQLAKERSLPLVDTFVDYQQVRERDETAFRLLMSDEIHPNMHGHRRFAEQMAKVIVDRKVNLENVPPPADSLHHTLARLEKGEGVHIVAMPPYDELVPAALKQLYPQAEIRTTSWPVQSKSMVELSQWAVGIRNLRPDLVAPAVPAATTATDQATYVREYEWVLNRSFPFAGNAWDVMPILPGVAAPINEDQLPNAALARHIVLGKDVRFVERATGSTRSVLELLTAWIRQQR